MKKYFEYPLDEEKKKEILAFYEATDSGMHKGTDLKTDLKIARIKELFPLKKVQSVADVGCSTGRLLNSLSFVYDKGAGFDISHNMIQENKKNNKNDKIEYREFNGIDLNKAEEYDYIFLLDVLEHSFEPDRLIKSLYSALNRGGVLFVEVPATGWLSELIFGKYHYGHLRYYDESYLVAYLRQQGFNIINSKTYKSVPAAEKILKYKTLYRILNKICSMIPEKLYPYYGSVVAIAQKDGGRGFK